MQQIRAIPEAAAWLPAGVSVLAEWKLPEELPVLQPAGLPKEYCRDDISPVIEFINVKDRERPGSIRRNSPVNGHDYANVTVCSVGDELPVDKCNRSLCRLPSCVPAIRRDLNCPLCSGQVRLHLERMPRCERGGTRGDYCIRYYNLLLPAGSQRGIRYKRDGGKDKGGRHRKDKEFLVCHENAPACFEELDAPADAFKHRIQVDNSTR